MLNRNQSRRKGDPEESQAHVHRRSVDSDAVLFLHTRMDDHERAINQIIESQRDMAQNLKTLTSNLGRVAEVLEAWNNAKGFWVTLRTVSAFVRFILPIVGFMAALWVLVKTGQWVETR